MGIEQMATRRRNRTYYNEIEESQPRHLLLKGIKVFNRTAMALIAAWLIILIGHQVRQWALHSPVFETKRVVVRGHDVLPEDEILTLAAIEPRCNLFRVHTGDIRDRLMGHVYIRSARIQRRWPSTLILSVEERRPVVRMMDRRACIDSEGIVLPPSSSVDCGLPLLSGVDLRTEQYGQPVESEKIRWAVSFLNGAGGVCSDVYLKITNIDITNVARPLLYVNETDIPIRIHGTDCYSRLIPLPWVLEDLKRKGIAAEYIDLRFDEQIVVKPRFRRSFGHSTVSERSTKEDGGKEVGSPRG